MFFNSKFNPTANLLLNNAIQLHNSNNYLSASKLYEKVLKLDKNNIDALQLLATAKAQLRDYDGALELFKKVLTLKKNDINILNNLANVYVEIKQYEEALRCFEIIISINKADSTIFFNYGNLLNTLHFYDKAIDSYSRSIDLDNQNFGAYNNLGNLFSKLNNYDSAISCFNKAISVNPNHSPSYNNRGLLHHKNGDLGEALVDFKKAISLNSSSVEALDNLGITLIELNQFKEAILIFNKAIDINPHYHQAFYNRGNALKSLNKFEECLSNYEQAIKINPDFANAHWNKSLALLSNNQFNLGWDLFGWRWKCENHNSSFYKTEKPYLENLNINRNSTILVWSEQGVGDQVLFASILNDFFLLFPNTYVELDSRLITFFERSMPNYKFLDRSIGIPIDFDFHISICDLGKFLRRSSNDFSYLNKGYLIPDTLKSDKLKHELIKDKVLLCGISWQSKNKKYGNGKSISLESLLPILSLRDISFVSLQYGDVEKEISEFNIKYDVAIQECKAVDNFLDLDSHASLIEACDFVITVSNTTAHIAGAIGKDTFLVCPSTTSAFWYWCNQDLGKSMWYPSISIHTENDSYDLNNLINSISEILKRKLIVTK